MSRMNDNWEKLSDVCTQTVALLEIKLKKRSIHRFTRV